MDGNAEVTFSHVGICVSDLERSVRFYCEGLGFELVQSHTVGQEFGPLMEIDDVALQSRFVRRDGVSIELLHFDSPGHCGEAVRRPMNQLGLTHLSLRVADLDAVAGRIESLGGTVVAEHPDDLRFGRIGRCPRLRLLHRPRRDPHRAHAPPRMSRGLRSGPWRRRHPSTNAAPGPSRT